MQVEEKVSYRDRGRFTGLAGCYEIEIIYLNNIPQRARLSINGQKLEIEGPYCVDKMAKTCREFLSLAEAIKERGKEEGKG